jgi:hypothetical protein
MTDHKDLQFKRRKNASPNGWGDRVKADPNFTTTGGEHKGFWLLGKITKRILGIEG